jgi:hypothetical protein
MSRWWWWMVLGWSSGPWPMWVILGQICGRGVTKISWCDLPNFSAKILPDNIHRANQLHFHPYHHLLTCQDNDDEWFWVCHLAHVSHAGSDLLSGCDKNQLMWFAQLFSQNPIRQHPYRANQFHAHPCHHPLICLDNNNEWFWVGHLAHVSHTGSDLWSGCNKNQLMWFAQLFSQNPIRQHPYRANQFHVHPYHHLLIYSDDGKKWFWVGHLAHLWVMLGQICDQGVTMKSADVICPTFQQKSYQSTSIEPIINSMLIHAIISWYV